MFRVKQILAAVSLCLLGTLSYTPTVYAAQATSPNYGVSEVNFGSGGVLRACSTAYCARQSAGELAVGETSSTSYTAHGGFNTNREELLEVSVDTTPIALGVLSTTATGAGSTTFSVRAYLASGYVVTISGNTPSNASGGHQLAAMASAAASQVGTEQFGINLVANTVPAVGANPVQLPDNTFAFGIAAAGYNTANNFKYASHDTIARSLSSSGTTNYTMSVIENISTGTPAGQYRGNMVIGVVPSF